MKELALFIFVQIVCGRCDAQTSDDIYSRNDTAVLSRDTAVRHRLGEIDFRAFVGKKVKVLLRNPALMSYRAYSWSTEPPGKLNELILVYAPGLQVRIQPSTIRHQRGFSKDLEFDFERFRKERIGNIEFDPRLFDEKIVGNVLR